MRGLSPLSIIVLLVAPATGEAQAPIRQARNPASAVFAVRHPSPLDVTLAEPDTVRPRSIGTYAKEGAIAGGLLGAIGGGLLAEVACGLSEDASKSCTGSFLIGGVVGGALGALPGALIGGLFPKYPKSSKAVDPE